MMHSRLWSTCVLLACLLLPCPRAAGQAATPAGGGTTDDPVLAGLTSGEPGRVAGAVAEIKGRLAEPPGAGATREQRAAWNRTIGGLKKTWMPALIQGGHHDAAAELALAGVLAEPRTHAIDRLGRLRAEALLAAGRTAEALAASRDYYDACSVGQTGAAVDLVARCLEAAWPDQPDVGRRFRLEQADGADTRPWQSPAPAPPAPAPPVGDSPGVGLLAGIPPDPAVEAEYEAALGRHPVVKDNPFALVKNGNLLLLAGDPERAEAAFGRAAEVAARNETGPAASPEFMAEALDGVGRCMKAHDGTVGRANAYVLQLRERAERPTQRGGDGPAGGL